MKLKIMLPIFLFFALYNFCFIASADQQMCTRTDEPNFKLLNDGFIDSLNHFVKDPSECETLSAIKDSKTSFDKIVEADKGAESIVLASSEPRYRTSNSVSYNFNGKKLNPGESIYIWVPSDLAKRGLNFVILAHRQNPSTDTGRTPGEKMDKKPGLTSVQVYDTNRPKSERWRYWAGNASGKNGSKFAESSYDFEIEGLYQWSKLGHTTVGKNSSVLHDELKPTVVRLVSSGDDPVEIGELTVKANPLPSEEFVEKIFTKGTSFGDIQSGQGYSQGGGQNSMGTFPDALVLNGSTESSQTLPTGWKYQHGELWIPLPKGKILTGIEMSGGDSHPDKIKNSDGGWGTKGWSKLNVSIVKDGIPLDRMLRRENVPPEGFLTTSPSKCGQVIGENEFLIIQAESDTMYLAGLRIGFKKP